MCPFWSHWARTRMAGFNWNRQRARHQKGIEMVRAWVVALVVLAALQIVGAQRGQSITRPTPFDPDDIAGVVTSQNGAEAGVLVTAWTDELPTPFSRTVVTDADGRYLLPDLPTAYYKITVHGD